MPRTGRRARTGRRSSACQASSLASGRLREARTMSALTAASGSGSRSSSCSTASSGRSCPRAARVACDPPGEAEVVGGRLVELGEVLGGDGVGRQGLQSAPVREVGVRPRARRPRSATRLRGVGDPVDRGVLARDQRRRAAGTARPRPATLLGLEHAEDAGQGVLGAQLALDEHVVGRGDGQRPGDGVGERGRRASSIRSSEAGSVRAAANVRSWSLTSRRSQSGSVDRRSRCAVGAAPATSPTCRRPSPSSA